MIHGNYTEPLFDEIQVERCKHIVFDAVNGRARLCVRLCARCLRMIITNLDSRVWLLFINCPH